DCDGRELPQGQEARAALRRLSFRRIRREGHVCRGARRDWIERRRADRRDRTGRQGPRSVRQVGRRRAGSGRGLQEDRARPARPLIALGYLSNRPTQTTFGTPISELAVLLVYGMPAAKLDMNSGFTARGAWERPNEH